MKAIRRVCNNLKKRQVGYISRKKGQIFTYYVVDIYEKGTKIMKVRNNPHARNPTFAKLLDFLKKDKTDMMLYVPGSFVCGDFAIRIHNNAEANGIRCGLARVHFKGSDTSHACNVFNTADKGLIFTDSTGECDFESYAKLDCYDAIAYITKGKQLLCQLIDSEQKYLVGDERVVFTKVFW